MSEDIVFEELDGFYQAVYDWRTLGMQVNDTVTFDDDDQNVFVATVIGTNRSLVKLSGPGTNVIVRRCADFTVYPNDDPAWDCMYQGDDILTPATSVPFYIDWPTLFDDSFDGGIVVIHARFGSGTEYITTYDINGQPILIPAYTPYRQVLIPRCSVYSIYADNCVNGNQYLAVPKSITFVNGIGTAEGDFQYMITAGAAIGSTITFNMSGITGAPANPVTATLTSSTSLTLINPAGGSFTVPYCVPWSSS